MNKHTSSIMNRLLSLGGVLIILSLTIHVATRAASNTVPPTVPQMRLWMGIVIFGVLINQVGVWGMAGRLLGSNRRKYLQLRTEVETFLERVCELNSACVEERTEDVDRLTLEMQASVERMKVVAGVVGTEEPAAAPRLGSEDASPAPSK